MMMMSTIQAIHTGLVGVQRQLQSHSEQAEQANVSLNSKVDEISRQHRLALQEVQTRGEEQVLQLQQRQYEDNQQLQQQQQQQQQPQQQLHNAAMQQLQHQLQRMQQGQPLLQQWGGGQEPTQGDLSRAGEGDMLSPARAQEQQLRHQQEQLQREHAERVRVMDMIRPDRGSTAGAPVTMGRRNVNVNVNVMPNEQKYA